MKPLAGITVIALEHAIAAPFCTRQLADLGARVIKVERPKVGDFARKYDERVGGMASHFVWTNRSKESLTLDMKSEVGQEVLHRLLANADILIQNLVPGAARRLGLSFEALSEVNPRLIVCDISGYGDDLTNPGPYRDQKAYDLLIQSESSFLSVTGTPDECVKAGCSVADIAAGMYAYTNILVALIERQQTGKGKRINISMLESMVEWMGYPLYYAINNQPAPPRTGASHATIYPYGTFTTSDQKQVILGIQNEPEWHAFCEIVLEKTEFAMQKEFSNNTLRMQHRQQLKTVIDEVFSQHTQAEILARLEKAHIAHANINTMKDVWAHPQLKARDRWVEVDTPVGRIPALKPVGLNNRDDFVMERVPDLGENSHNILNELGYTDEQIVAFREATII